MTDKELFKKIQILRQIKPREDWVIFVKNQILEQEKIAEKEAFGKWKKIWTGLKFIFSHKYVFALSVVLITVIGLFGFALRLGPGDTIKEIAEEGKTIFLTKEEKIKFYLVRADSRLEEIVKKVQENDINDIKEISPIINEYKADVSEAAKILLGEKDKKKIKNSVSEVKKLENKEGLIQSLGIELGENLDKDLALVKLIAEQVKEIEARKNLNLEDKQALYQIKDFAEKGYYTEALDLVLLLNNNIK